MWRYLFFVLLLSSLVLSKWTSFGGDPANSHRGSSSFPWLAPELLHNFTLDQFRGVYIDESDGSCFEDLDALEAFGLEDFLCEGETLEDTEGNFYLVCFGYDGFEAYSMTFSVTGDLEPRWLTCTGDFTFPANSFSTGALSADETLLALTDFSGFIWVLRTSNGVVATKIDGVDAGFNCFQWSGSFPNNPLVIGDNILVGTTGAAFGYADPYSVIMINCSDYLESEPDLGLLLSFGAAAVLPLPGMMTSPKIFTASGVDVMNLVVSDGLQDPSPIQFNFTNRGSSEAATGLVTVLSDGSVATASYVDTDETLTVLVVNPTYTNSQEFIFQNGLQGGLFPFSKSSIVEGHGGSLYLTGDDCGLLSVDRNTGNFTIHRSILTAGRRCDSEHTVVDSDGFLYVLSQLDLRVFVFDSKIKQFSTQMIATLDNMLLDNFYFAGGYALSFGSNGTMAVSSSLSTFSFQDYPGSKRSANEPETQDKLEEEGGEHEDEKLSHKELLVLKRMERIKSMDWATKRQNAPKHKKDKKKRKNAEVARGSGPDTMFTSPFWFILGCSTGVNTSTGECIGDDFFNETQSESENITDGLSSSEDGQRGSHAVKLHNTYNYIQQLVSFLFL